MMRKQSHTVVWMFGGVVGVSSLLTMGCGDEVGVGKEGQGGEGGISFGGTVLDLCGNGVDDDQNGKVDDGCPCLPGETQKCFTGEYPSPGVGVCVGGVQTCPLGKEFGNWGEAACQNEPLPSMETCNMLDDDCDGIIDESCSCMPGETRDCGGDFPSKPPCKPGKQECKGDGTWSSECIGAVGPTAEVCGDGIDNDCDGNADPDTFCKCMPAPEVCGNGMDEDCDGQVDEGCCPTNALTVGPYKFPDETWFADSAKYGGTTHQEVYGGGAMTLNEAVAGYTPNTCVFNIGFFADTPDGMGIFGLETVEFSFLTHPIVNVDGPDVVLFDVRYSNNSYEIAVGPLGQSISTYKTYLWMNSTPTGVTGCGSNKLFGVEVDLSDYGLPLGAVADRLVVKADPATNPDPLVNLDITMVGVLSPSCK